MAARLVVFAEVEHESEVLATTHGLNLAKATRRAIMAASSAFLVAESRFASHELRGLDEPVEIFAVEQNEPWGEYWSDLLEDEVPAEPAEEGSLLLRPLRPASSIAGLSWEADGATRHLQIPPRTIHRDAELPRPQPVSNDLFIELRYSLPPSLIVHFDFADLALGIFRAFALPLKEGEAMLRLLLVLDPDAVTKTLQAAAGQSSAARRWRGTALRLERFLSAAAGAPPSSCWPARALSNAWCAQARENLYI